MAEYKGKLLNGLYTQAKNVLLSNGSDVESSMFKVIQGPATNDATAITNWLTTNNADIPVGSNMIDFQYALGMCSKATSTVGRIRFVSYYVGLDNKSSSTVDGTWSTIS